MGIVGVQHLLLHHSTVCTGLQSPCIIIHTYSRNLSNWLFHTRTKQNCLLSLRTSGAVLICITINYTLI